MANFREVKTLEHCDSADAADRGPGGSRWTASGDGFPQQQSGMERGKHRRVIWCRWQIEVFFKEIKQTLQLADFLGTSANAVRWQVWTALLAYLLFRYISFLSDWSHSFPRLLTLIRTCLWKKWDLLSLIKIYGTADGHFRYMALQSRHICQAMG